MKIVLYFKKLNIGGAERSTIRLLNEFNEAGHDVTLFLKTKGGRLENELNPNIKKIWIYEDNGELTDWDRSISGLFKIPIINIIRAATQFLIGLIKITYFYITKPKFDLAITGWHGYDPKFLKFFTRYKCHFQMIRNENAIVINGKTRSNLFILKDNLKIVDKYICVSEYIRKLLIKHAEISPEKVCTIYNIINIPNLYISDVISKPTEYEMATEEELIITTICRLVDGAKALFRMVRVCRALLDKGHKFKWFVIGDGIDREKMQLAIHSYGLENVMILCGFKQDPIPFYKYADLIAVLSYVEGLCGVVNEAKLLKKPVIATRFSGIDEQITHGINGFIVENNEESIIEGMEKMLQNPNMLTDMSICGLPQQLLDNRFKIRQFEDLFKECVL